MNEEISYKKISDLETYKFIIPSYQRGYRWTENNIVQLFDDIYEEDKEYYLQPLIINQNKYGKWTVIDGQQRLTTVFIMIAALKYLFELENLNCFSLSYENREFSEEFLNFLKESLKKREEIKREIIDEDTIWDYWKQSCENLRVEKENSNFLRMKKKNLDFEYMMVAFCTIVNKYESFQRFDKDYFINQLLKCKFVWYPLEINRDESVKEKEIEQFSKINTGKIPLTNAELIKVEILNHKIFKVQDPRTIQNRQVTISDRWYFMEKEFHKNDFWGFIPHKNQYRDCDYGNTRIDYLFEFLLFSEVINNAINQYKESINSEDLYKKFNLFIKTGNYKIKSINIDIFKKIIKDNNRFCDYEHSKLANRVDIFLLDEVVDESIKQYKKYIKEEDSYNLFNRFVKYIKKTDCKSEQLWTDIEEIFANLIDLYENDGRSIHYIGDIGVYNLLSLCVYYNNRQEEEDTYLKNYALFYKILKTDRNNRVHEIKRELKNILFPEVDISEKIKVMRYGDVKDELREILLLYNIIVLFQSKGTGNRYNFLEHSRKVWTREHIFPQSWKNQGDKTELKRSRKEILEAITSNLDSNGNIVLKNEMILRYVNLLYGKETSLRGNNGDLKKCTICPIENRDNLGIINFEKDRNVIDEFINRYLKKDTGNNDGKNEYLYDYCKKLVLIKKSSELLEKIYVCEENEKLSCVIYKDNFIEDYKASVVNHIKANEHIFLEYEMEKYLNIINFKDKDMEQILKNIKDVLNVFDIIPREESHKLSKLFYQINKIFEGETEQIDDQNVILSKNKEIEKAEKKLKVIFKEVYKYTIENIEMFTNNIKLIKEIIDSNISSINKDLINFFKDEFDKLIEDDSIGNMTLLDYKVNGSSEIANKLCSEKKLSIYQKAKHGDFIPLTTILTFSDIYTKSKNTDNYWMFESRCEYLQDILSTINNFLNRSN